MSAHAFWLATRGWRSMIIRSALPGQVKRMGLSRKSRLICRNLAQAWTMLLRKTPIFNSGAFADENEYVSWTRVASSSMRPRQSVRPQQHVISASCYSQAADQ